MATNNQIVVYLPLEGMESEHCALIIQRELAQLKNISTHKVELNNHRAILEVDNIETISLAIKAIKNAGYGVITVKKQYQF